MQAWQAIQVDAVDNEYDGKAGIIIRTHVDKNLYVVKLDDLDTPLTFAGNELKVLG